MLPSDLNQNENEKIDMQNYCMFWHAKWLHVYTTQDRRWNLKFNICILIINNNNNKFINQRLLEKITKYQRYGKGIRIKESTRLFEDEFEFEFIIIIYKRKGCFK